MGDWAAVGSRANGAPMDWCFFEGWAAQRTQRRKKEITLKKSLGGGRPGRCFSPDNKRPNFQM